MKAVTQTAGPASTCAGTLVILEYDTNEFPTI